MRFAKYFIISLLFSLVIFSILGYFTTYPKCIDNNDPACLGLYISPQAILLQILMAATSFFIVAALILLIINYFLNAENKFNIKKYFLILVFLLGGVSGALITTGTGYRYFTDIIAGSRGRYNICYDHNTSACKPLFDFLVDKKIISNEERNIADEKEYTDESVRVNEKKDLEEKIKSRKTEIDYKHPLGLNNLYVTGNDKKLDEYYKRLDEIYWQFPYSEKAKNKRREILNRYYFYEMRQRLMGRHTKIPETTNALPTNENTVNTAINKNINKSDYYLKHFQNKESNIYVGCENDADCILVNLYGCENFASINKNNSQEEIEKYINTEKELTKDIKYDCMTKNKLDYIAACDHACYYKQK